MGKSPAGPQRGIVRDRCQKWCTERGPAGVGDRYVDRELKDLEGRVLIVAQMLQVPFDHHHDASISTTWLIGAFTV